MNCNVWLLQSTFTILQNTEITKQLEYLRGVITNAFTDRDHAILEVIVFFLLYFFLRHHLLWLCIIVVFVSNVISMFAGWEGQRKWRLHVPENEWCWEKVHVNVFPFDILVPQVWRDVTLVLWFNMKVHELNGFFALSCTICFDIVWYRL